MSFNLPNAQKSDPNFEKPLSNLQVNWIGYNIISQTEKKTMKQNPIIHTESCTSKRTVLTNCRIVKPTKDFNYESN